MINKIEVFTNLFNSKKSFFFRSSSEHFFITFRKDYLSYERLEIKIIINFIQRVLLEKGNPKLYITVLD